MRSYCLAAMLCLLSLLAGVFGWHGAARVAAAAPFASTVPLTSALIARCDQSAAGPITVAPDGSQSRRIQFKPGASSACVESSMPVSGMDSYVLKAMQGQAMWVTLTASEGAAILVIWGADGTVLISDHADATSWNGELPSTQDYNIDVRGSPDSATTYTLWVVIPPKTTGKTVVVDDEVALNAGDQLDVTLDSNPTTGYVWETQSLDTAVLQQVGEAEFTVEGDAVGAGGKQTLHFVALARGSTQLQLVYHRPWETGEPPIKTFDLNVTIR